MGQRFPMSVCVMQPGIQIVTSGTSATGTIPLLANSFPPKLIRIGSTTAACVRLFPPAGGNATVADTQVQPGDSLILEVPAGITKISAIMVSAAGVVQVSPLENM